MLRELLREVREPGRAKGGCRSRHVTQVQHVWTFGKWQLTGVNPTDQQFGCNLKDVFMKKTKGKAPSSEAIQENRRSPIEHVEGLFWKSEWGIVYICHAHLIIQICDVSVYIILHHITLGCNLYVGTEVLFFVGPEIVFELLVWLKILNKKRYYHGKNNLLPHGNNFRSWRWTRKRKHGKPQTWQRCEILLTLSPALKCTLYNTTISDIKRWKIRPCLLASTLKMSPVV